MNREELYTDRLHRVQALRPGDVQQRLCFSHWLLGKFENDQHFLERVVWSDESQFTRDGINNVRNQHVWSIENPHVVKNRNFLDRFSINIWGGICNGHLLN